MASVTGITAERAQEIWDASVISGEVNESTGRIEFTTRGGTVLDGGSVVNPYLQMYWPIGSIHISVSSTNPATTLGVGTWVRFGKGKTLVSLDELQTEFDTVEETGGVKEVTLTAAQSGLPAHHHRVTGYGQESTDSTGGGRLVSGDSSAVPGTSPTNINTTDTVAADATAAHTNLSPYITVYVWKRTA